MLIKNAAKDATSELTDELARELAREFATALAYVELHCHLMKRYLLGSLPAVPNMPSFADEVATLNALAQYLDDKSTVELQETLAAAVLAFEQVANGCFRSENECTGRLYAARMRAARSREWLMDVAKGPVLQKMPDKRQTGKSQADKRQNCATGRVSGGLVEGSGKPPNSRAEPPGYGIDNLALQHRGAIPAE